MSKPSRGTRGGTKTHPCKPIRATEERIAIQLLKPSPGTGSRAQLATTPRESQNRRRNRNVARLNLAHANLANVQTSDLNDLDTTKLIIGLPRADLTTQVKCPRRHLNQNYAAESNTYTPRAANLCFGRNSCRTKTNVDHNCLGRGCGQRWHGEALVRRPEVEVATACNNKTASRS